MMPDAKSIIREIENLPPEEREKAFAYCRNCPEPEEISPEYEAELLQSIEETRQGINVSPVFNTAKEAIAYLTQLEKYIGNSIS